MSRGVVPSSAQVRGRKRETGRKEARSAPFHTTSHPPSNGVCSCLCCSAGRGRLEICCAEREGRLECPSFRWWWWGKGEIHKGHHQWCPFLTGPPVINASHVAMVEQDAGALATFVGQGTDLPCCLDRAPNCLGSGSSPTVCGFGGLLALCQPLLEPPRMAVLKDGVPVSLNLNGHAGQSV